MLDFFSDTKTKPTRAMRLAMAEAEVGDEQKFEDPTTNALQDRVAALLGKEAALFLPSGTMCNEIAIAVHCRPGDEVICDRTAHIVTAEGGGPAALSGVMVNVVDGDRGVFTVDQMQAAMRPHSRYLPKTRLVVVEQTANLGGGTVWPLHQVTEVAEAAKAAGLATHMDGARLINAVVATGVPAAEFCAGMDSCWLDFSKGLGAPVGAVLAGSAEFIGRAWQFKQMWGGALRQSGILTAACLHALDHHIDRLADDHRLAQRIGRRLQAHPKVVGINRIDTNLIFIDVAEDGPDADAIVTALRDAGIQVGAFGPRRLRIVTHLDVDEAAADALCAALEGVLGT